MITDADTSSPARPAAGHGAHRPLTYPVLLGADPSWAVADPCEGCGELHPGACPVPVTGPPEELFDGDEGLTPLGAVVEDAVQYLAARGYLGDEPPDWVLAELAALARGARCGKLCGVTPEGLIRPSAVADHFMTRRRQQWERWLPVWACACGRTFKLHPGPPGMAFYETRPDGLLGDRVGDITLAPGPRQPKALSISRGQGQMPEITRQLRPAPPLWTVKESDACPACMRLFADTIAGRPVTPRPARPAAIPAAPPLTLF